MGKRELGNIWGVGVKCRDEVPVSGAGETLTGLVSVVDTEPSRSSRSSTRAFPLVVPAGVEVLFDLRLFFLGAAGPSSPPDVVKSSVWFPPVRFLRRPIIRWRAAARCSLSLVVPVTVLLRDMLFDNGKVGSVGSKPPVSLINVFVRAL